MAEIFDTVIIGGGPAGYTAALYAARAGLSVLVLEKMSAGGQMALTDRIENYPGFEDGIDGLELGMKMRAQAEKFGAVTRSRAVLSCELGGEIKKIVTKRDVYEARTVIVATGADPRKTGVDGEDMLVGRGLHYCAHCDGGFYSGKSVAVIGGGNSAVADALYLSRICDKVTVIHRRDELRVTKVYHEPLMRTENVDFLWNSTVESFIVGERLEGLKLKNTVSGEICEKYFDGVFVSIGRSPCTELFRGQLELDGYGYIVADESTKTNLSGVFAAGDVRTKTLRQVVTAVADGAAAAHHAEEYLSTLK